MLPAMAAPSVAATAKHRRCGVDCQADHSLHGNPLIHRSMSPRRLLYQKPIDDDPTKRLRPDGRLDIQVEPTAGSYSSLDRVEPSLPALDARLIAQTVFHEDKPAAGLQDAADFAHRRPHVGDAAKR